MMVPLSGFPLDEKHTLVTDADVTSLCFRLDVMIKQEETSYIYNDYMAANQRSLRFVHNAVDEKFRSAMCQWCYTVTHIHRYQRETVVQAFSYLDRYLCTNQGRTAIVHRDIYQLAVTTALFIAIKVNEEHVISIEELLELSSGTFSQRSVERMETRMLDALEWKIDGPTPGSFIQCFSALIPEALDSAIVSYAHQEVQLAISKYDFVKYRPSEIAVAALVEGVLNMDNKILPQKFKEDLICTIKWVCGLFIDVRQDAHECLCFLLGKGSHQQKDSGADNDSEISTHAPANKPVKGKSNMSISSTDCNNCASSHGIDCDNFESDSSSLSCDDEVISQNYQTCEQISFISVTNGLAGKQCIETNYNIGARETSKKLELNTKPTLLPDDAQSNCCSHALSA